jgi:hypothetical protein
MIGCVAFGPHGGEECVVANRWLTGLLVAALLPLVAMPAAAQGQDVPRTIEQYDREAGVQYVAVWEKGDRWGHVVLIQGGYKVATLYGWQVQGIAEFMAAGFDYYDSTFKQFALGVRLGKLMWPKVRPFGQFQVGVQNDGFDNSSNGAVYIPGLGVNYAVTRRLDAQLLVDFPIADYDSGTFNQTRIGIGVGLPLGRR